MTFSISHCVHEGFFHAAEEYDAEKQHDNRDDPADAVVEPVDVADAEITVAENIHDRGHRVAHVKAIILPARREACDGEHVIRNWRGVHPKLHAESNQHTKVSVLCRSGRDDDTNPKAQHSELEDEYRSHKKIPVWMNALCCGEIDHKNDHERELDRKIDQLRHHCGDRHDKTREIDLSQNAAVCDKGIRSGSQAAGKVMPDHVGRQIEDEGRNAVRSKACNIAENQREDNRGQQRLNDSPGRAEHRLLIQRDEVALDEQEDQVFIACEFPQIEIKPAGFRPDDSYRSVFIHASFLQKIEYFLRDILRCAVRVFLLDPCVIERFSFLRKAEVRKSLRRKIDVFFF